MKTSVILTCGIAALLLTVNANAYSPIAPGDLVVYRVGDGSAALSSTTSVVFLDEYTQSGTLVQSIAMPTVSSGGQSALFAQGNSTSEGLLTLSTDGSLLMLTGYAVTSTNPSIQAASSVNRVVGEVAVNGSGIDTSTVLSDAASASSVRAAASTDGTSIWISGGAGAVRYTTKGSTTSTQLITTPTNLRQVAIFNGQLMISDASGTAVRIGTVGSGLPTTSGQTATALPGTSGSSPTGPYAFTMLRLGAGPGAPDTMYVSDDGASTLEKWSLSGGTWSMTGSIAVSAPRGVAAVLEGDGVHVFFTATGGVTNIMEITDSSGLGGSLSGTATTIAQASPFEAFRGIVVTIPEPSTMLLVSAGLVGLLAIRRRRS